MEPHVFNRPLCALLLLALLPTPAWACDGGVFVATGDIDGFDPGAGFPVAGLTMRLESIEPDEIDYDGSQESIEPDEIDYQGSEDSTACLQDGTLVNATGALGLSSVVIVEGLELRSIEPDEIDDAWVREMLASTPLAETREHVLLARQGGPTLAETTTVGRAVLRLDDIVVVEELVSRSPYTTRLVAELTFTVVDLVVEDPTLEPVSLWIDGDTTLELMPEIPVCSRC
jgi:hypothetical protein